MAKSSRDTRAEILILWYSQWKAEQSSDEDIKNNQTYGNYFIFESELEKVKENLEKLPLDPENWDDFVAFLHKFEFVSVPKYKSRGGGSGGSTKLPTVEKAQELGIAEADIPKYVETMKGIYLLKAEAESVMGGKKIAISIPNREPKETKES